ncbi:MAG: Mth938-like domain-containing protein, partial [Alphaproteobacteria bacterium]
MNDITPAVPAGRQLIQGYGGGNFRIASNTHSGSVIILPETTVSWNVSAYEGLSPACFAVV